MTTRDTIVVGVDGSEGSVAALRWALEEAKLRRTRVLAISCWGYPQTYGADIGAYAVLNPAVYEDSARATLEHAVEQARTGLVDPAHVDESVRPAPAGTELIEASRDAALLVVGARGHGGFLGLLLGSVASQTVHHAHCPVVVVPAAGRDDVPGSTDDAPRTA